MNHRIVVIAFLAILHVHAIAAAECVVMHPPKESRVRREITKTLLAGSGKDKRLEVSYFAVCGQWALVDSVICGPGCPEGGYTILHRHSGKWRLVQSPDADECEPEFSPFLAPEDEGCRKAVLAMYPRFPRQLLIDASKRPDANPPR